MEQSNIFAYIELKKLLHALDPGAETETLHTKLLANAAYFKIIKTEHFSSSLASEWENIISYTTQKEAQTDQDGRVVCPAVRQTILTFSDDQSEELYHTILQLFDKLKKEFL